MYKFTVCLFLTGIKKSVCNDQCYCRWPVACSTSSVWRSINFGCCQKNTFKLHVIVTPIDLYPFVPVWVLTLVQGHNDAEKGPLSVEQLQSPSWLFCCYGTCRVCLCCHNPPNSDMDYRTFSVHTGVNACDCIQGLRGVRTPKESLNRKLTLGRESLAAPGNQTCMCVVMVRHSTNWATSHPQSNWKLCCLGSSDLIDFKYCMVVARTDKMKHKMLIRTLTCFLNHN